jgi:4-hydroxy-tetrahydrodipicolinate reductase
MSSQTTKVKTVKVVIAGINGRMGRASAHLLLSSPDFELVGAYGRSQAAYVGADVRQLAGLPAAGNTAILVSNGFSEAVKSQTPDVLLDFTKAEGAMANARQALEHGIRPITGTSGIAPEHVKELADLAAKKKLGAMVVPNFSVGAVLMMEFARQAAQMFNHAEIVEIHHTGKADAPSGTAMYTLNKMSAAGQKFNQDVVHEKELLAGARGGKNDAGVHVHSLRLPGVLSHQEVIFGSEGELLTIRHDSFNTNCFIKGITLALNAVLSLDHLVVGLEGVLMQEAR